MIQALNNMGKNTRIDPGQKLKIPAVGSDTAPASSRTQLAAASTNGDGEITYIIKNNDTLYFKPISYSVSLFAIKFSILAYFTEVRYGR